MCKFQSQINTVKAELDRRFISNGQNPCRAPFRTLLFLELHFLVPYVTFPLFNAQVFPLEDIYDDPVLGSVLLAVTREEADSQGLQGGSSEESYLSI